MKALAILIGLIIATVVMLPSNNGITITPDSINYISIASSLAHGRGPRDYAGDIVLVHPFGYALALAPLLAVGMPYNGAAVVLNFAAVFVVYLFSWLILRRWQGDDWRALACAVPVAICPSLLAYSNAALTESMFCALAVVFVWAVVRGQK